MYYGDWLSGYRMALGNLIQLIAMATKKTRVYIYISRQIYRGMRCFISIGQISLDRYTSSRVSTTLTIFTESQISKSYLKYQLRQVYRPCSTFQSHYISSVPDRMPNSITICVFIDRYTYPDSFLSWKRECRKRQWKQIYSHRIPNQLISLQGQTSNLYIHQWQ